jgi:hypothetical protein
VDFEMTRLGLSASRSEIIKGGRPYRAIGLNFYSLFNRGDVADQLALLARRGVPFVRYNAGQYEAGANNSVGWRQHLTNPAAWWAKNDEIVAAAEAADIGLIPSLFWRYATIPDLMAFTSVGKRDTLSQWGVRASNTRAFVRDYTATFVDRYASSPAIWGWEMGNEFESYADLFPRATFISRADGSPTEYTVTPVPSTANGATDAISLADLAAASADWCSVVAEHDPHGRIRSSGNALSLPTRYNQFNNLSAGLDTYAQWMAGAPGNLPWPEFENPRCYDVLSAHSYQQARRAFWYWNDQTYAKAAPESLIGLLKSIAESFGRPLFLGEWGAIRGDRLVTPDATAETAQFATTLAAIVRERVPLSALWNYGYQTNGSGIEAWNVDLGTARQYQLDALTAANGALLAAS